MRDLLLPFVVLPLAQLSAAPPDAGAPRQEQPWIAQSDRDSNRPDLNPPIYDGPPPKDQHEAVRARREAKERKRMEEEARRRRAFEAARQQRKK
jgi:hypothetical protein